MRDGEIASARYEPDNWLANAKCSSLKQYTYKRKKMKSLGYSLYGYICYIYIAYIYAYIHIHTNI